MLPSRSPSSLSDPQLEFNESQSNRQPFKNTNRFEGFEFLRAIGSVVVVALKSNLFLATETFFSTTVAYVLAAEIGYLPVPIFIQISLFLLYLKTQQGNAIQYFLQKRLPKLISLYLFWVGLKTLFDVIHGEFQVQDLTASPRAFVEFIVSGNASPFFFFFSLIFLSILATVLSVVFRQIKQDSRALAVKYFLLFASCAFVFVLSIADIIVAFLSGQPASGLASSIASLTAWDYNPICFLPYLFTTAIVAQELQEKKLERWTPSLKLKACILLFLAIAFSILEWHFFKAMLHYSRLSLVFSSWLILYWALLTSRKPSKFIQLLATCSLGIYGFHVFFTQYFPWERIPVLASFFPSMPLVEAFASFLLALVGSICLTLAFRRVKWLKNFV